MIIMAGPTDWARVRDIRLRSLREAPEAYGSSYELEVGLSDQDWEERVATAHTYLAMEGPTAVGTVTGLWARDGDMHLVGMYVAPASRGTGLAHALIDAVVGVTERRGGSRVVLRVAEGNDRAERCYTRYGFVATGRRTTREVKPELTEYEYAYLLEPSNPLEPSNTVTWPG